MAEKVTRVLHSQGLNAAKYDRLARIAVQCGKVRADAWQRCSGVSTVLQSPYAIRDAWMAEGCDWHGLPAQLGKATLADALGDIQAGREAAKVPVKKAIRHRTRGNSAERERLYSLPSKTARPRTRSCTGRCSNSGGAVCRKSCHHDMR